MFKLFLIITLAIVTAEFIKAIFATLIKRVLEKVVITATKKMVDEATKDFPKPDSKFTDYTKPNS